MAVARTSSPRTWPHSLKLLLEVMIMVPRSYLRDELEDHVGFGPVQGQVADFIDHENGGSEEGLELPVEPAGGLGGAEPADQVVEGGEVDRQAGGRRRRPTRRRAWFADPGGPSRATLDLALANSKGEIIRKLQLNPAVDYQAQGVRKPRTKSS